VYPGSVGETPEIAATGAHSMASMGQSRSGATSDSNSLAALHSGLEQAHELRGGALDSVVGIADPYLAMAYCRNCA
jgi:hypothetical protein